MKKEKTIPSLLLALLMLTGCMRDNFSDCLYITFDTLNPKHSYSDLVEYVSLYFYNENGDLVKDYHYAKNELRRSDRAAIVPNLPAGKYKVVAIVNDGLYTTTEDYKSYSTLHTKLNAETLSDNVPPLFFAEKEITMGVDPGAAQIENMTLSKLNSNVYVHLLYENDQNLAGNEAFAPYEPTEGTNLTTWIEGANSRYFYSLNAGSTKVVSNPWNRIDNGTLNPEHYLPDHPAEFALSIMYIRHDSDLTLHLSERPEQRTSEDLELRYITVNITDYLRRMQESLGVVYATDKDFQRYLDYEDEFHIWIRLGSVVEIITPSGGYVIDVLGWDFIHEDIPL